MFGPSFPGASRQGAYGSSFGAPPTKSASGSGRPPDPDAAPAAAAATDSNWSDLFKDLDTEMAAQESRKPPLPTLQK